MSCCGGAPDPKRVDRSLKKRALAVEYQRIEYCSHCNKPCMVIIIKGRSRVQCTNPECRKIQ